MVGDVGKFSQNGVNVNNMEYQQYFKVTQVPTPAQIFAFIEEHPGTISDGYFLNQPDTWKWLRLPAAWHGGGANLSFTDGHMETHLWKLASTKQPVLPGVTYPPIALPHGEWADFQWLMDRTSTESYSADSGPSTP
jgi:prepilin-type processing-associated H-X9-DG protein